MAARLDESTKRLLERNITLHYITAGASWLRFFLPIFALFYIASHVTLTQIGIIMGVFGLTIALFTVPMGVVADFLGKKRVLLLARTCYFIEIILLAFTNGFWPFLLAKIISGIGIALAAGAYEGMLFDTLKRLGRTEEHKKISGRGFMIQNVTLTVVSIVGAWLFTLSPKLPALVSLPCVVFLIAATAWFTEPYPVVKKVTKEHSYAHIKESWLITWHSPVIRYYLFYCMALFTTINIVFTIESAYFAAAGIPVAMIGFILAGSTLTTAVVAQHAHRVLKRFGELPVLQGVAAVVIIGFTAAAYVHSVMAVLVVFFLSCAWGLYVIGTNEYINHAAPTSHRVTVLSIAGVSGQIASAVFLPLATGIAHAVGMSIMMLFIAALALVGYTIAEVVRKTHHVS